jgi:hypothetical protein
MLVFGGGGGAAIPAPAGKEANLPSEKAGSAAVALSNSPLNNLKKLSDQTETQALLNENKAKKLMEHAEEASDQVEKLRSVFRMFGKK